jgi:uncharacterized membrane protein
MSIQADDNARVLDRAGDSRPRAGAAILGFAFGGFFDGILLHQVLQWHHFLSLVDASSLTDIRNQILADGLFHIAVFLLALAGIVMLWRRGQLPADRQLLGWAALGFGVWQFADVVWSIG